LLKQIIIVDIANFSGSKTVAVAQMEISTVAQTVIAGTLIFVAGQLLLKLVIDPVHQLKRTLAEISNTFVRYGHVIHNPDAITPELRDEVYDKLRQLSGQLYGDMALIPWYEQTSFLFCLPRKDKVYEAAKNLIGAGNWMYGNSAKKFDHTVRNIQRACDNLGLYIAPGNRIPEELLNK